MFFKQFYLGCLSHASYLIGSQGEAAVIDPQRDVDQYLEVAEKENLKIKYVIETHLHADFVSGHLELAERSGAQVVFSSSAGVRFSHLSVAHGDILKVGTLTLKILETPGHTLESICILMNDSSDPAASAKLFSGDTLFIGDVGRPDLVAAKGHSAEEMASHMYESLHNILMKLSDDTEVYPAHGAGSLCGKNLSSERSSTIGRERQFNYALQPMSKQSFINLLIADQPEVPAYFPKDVELNRLGASSLEKIPSPSLMERAEAIVEMQRGAVVLDLRTAEEFAQGHIAGSYNISLGGQFASWVGTIIEVGTPVILAAKNRAQIEEAVMRLARVGIESVIGCLSQDDSNWLGEPFDIERNETLSIESLKNFSSSDDKPLVLDVRRRAEFNAEHIADSLNIPLCELSQRAREIRGERKIAVICAGGYRSSIGTSILLRAGISSVFNVLGGMSAWKKAGNCVTSEQKITV